ncbi:hypothetical protein AVEN_133741-1 [Araneus ventricosus]|uniref:RNase H type-1 domain-containing protein n=1 Tax=Araneus ventricosus TaxID=182803 RepID=A0A4Y2BAG4_ARAVE|nr:hypothetical protein AVEN_133741-1 [Araneus ventricosus]
MDGRVGCAFAVFYNETEQHSTVFMAEVIAIQQAVQYVRANDLGERINLFGNSLPESERDKRKGTGRGNPWALDSYSHQEENALIAPCDLSQRRLN